MARFHRVTGTERPGESGFLFWCPGCETVHGVRETDIAGRTQVTGLEDDAPTLEPTLYFRMGGGRACHARVRMGRIEFLAGTTHRFAGETLELPDYPAA